MYVNRHTIANLLASVAERRGFVATTNNWSESRTFVEVFVPVDSTEIFAVDMTFADGRTTASIGPYGSPDLVREWRSPNEAFSQIEDEMNSRLDDAMVSHPYLKERHDALEEQLAQLGEGVAVDAIRAVAHWNATVRERLIEEIGSRLTPSETPASPALGMR